MLRALTYDLSLDDALDLAEIDAVSRSWRDAVQANADQKQQSQRKRGRRMAR